MKTNIILQGDALTKLKELPEKSINMVITSPPYWALRDYGVKNQLGMEQTPDLFVKRLCDVFDEVKRILKDEGIIFVNIADTYSSGNRKNNIEDPMNKKGRTTKPTPNRCNCGIVDKCLCMVPERFALEMIKRGWILRNVIIWRKPSCTPESAKDRFTRDFEYIYFFSKNKKYYFKQQIEKTKAKAIEPRMMEEKREVYLAKHKDGQGVKRTMNRNVRTTWTFNPGRIKDAHFAIYPEELCEIPIKAGCPEGGVVLDPFFGSGTTGVVALKQNKKFIGIELNSKYIEIAKRRLKPYFGTYGDWRDLPDKDYKQCKFCGKFFVDVDKHINKIHGGKEQMELGAKNK